MAKKKPKYNQNSVIRGALRRAFARSPIVQEVMNESRREVPRYNKDGSRHKKNWVQRQCQVCGEWCSTSKTVVDHIEPVISVEIGFVDWNEFVARLWCDKANLQRICDTCHDKKTYEEKITRLLKQYTEELDVLEATINGDWEHLDPKLLLKTINKYTAKKKSSGLQSVVQRAQILKDKINNKRGKNGRK
jgi:5-methylcytosine-specific restriction endonuclease McrA